MGRARSAKDFISGLNLASGLAFGHGGVFVLQFPYLLFYPDENRDDIPDSDPQVLLTGFGTEGAHSVANSLTLGPDGWLSGCQGSTVTANIRGIEFQQGVWRYHPISKRFEIFCEGGGNSWGLDSDEDGEHNANSVTLVAAKNEKITVSRDKIVSVTESSISMMPKGLMPGLRPEERRDLFAYLQK